MQDQINGAICLKDLNGMKTRLDSLLNPYGFECHPFKVGWYNDHVSKSFKLPHSSDTLAFIIISTPSMFEKSFIPFIEASDCVRSEKDPLDQCMLNRLSEIKKLFPSCGIDVIHDFEMTPNKRPKILVQTAGHVSGAVRYYQRSDLQVDPWDSKKKIFGVCLHPLYGGWFALRGVAIFTEVLCPDLCLQTSRKILNSDSEIAELLRRYNDHWEDWSFRDVIPVEERYSEEQKEYFKTKPSDRMEIIKRYQSAAKNLKSL